MEETRMWKDTKINSNNTEFNATKTRENCFDKNKKRNAH